MDGKMLHSPLLLLTLLIYSGSADFLAGTATPGDNRSSTPTGLPQTLSSSNLPFLFDPLTSATPSWTNTTSSTTSSPPTSAKSSASSQTDPGISTRSWQVNATTSETNTFVNYSVTEKQPILSSSQVKHSQVTSTFSTESSFAESTFSTDSPQANSTFSTENLVENSTSLPEAPLASSVSSASSHVSLLPDLNDSVVSSGDTSVSTTTETSQSVSSSSTKSLPVSSVPKTCGPAPETLVNLKGSVQWTGDPNTGCEEPHTWEWQVPADHGVVVHLQQIGNCIAKLYQLVSSDGQNELKEAYTWPRYLFPIAVVRGSVVMKAHTTSKRRAPLLKLRYEVYPVSVLPWQIDVKSQIASSAVMFNCSTTNSSVPQAFACDGVKHCVGDEDEKDCEYRSKGCGDWFPYNKHCLKLGVMLFFIDTGNIIPVTVPVKANEECQRKYGAKLAALPDSQGKRLVASMMYQSGAVSVSVNLRKVNPVSKKQHHLYRFTWQWGTKGSPIAYKETEIQRKGITKDCVMMWISPKVHFKAIRCFIHDTTSIFRSGYVCMKPNPDRTSPSKAEGVHLTKIPQKVRQVSTKRCPDGSVVQVFHQCQWQGQELSTQWSPNNFPLFQCQYGPPVHYTLVCDGLPDCVDGSDEAGCLFPRTMKNNHRLFVCESRQVIPRYRQCNGVADCFDGSDEVECTKCQGSKCAEVGCVPTGYVRFFPDQRSCTYSPPFNLKPDDDVVFPVSVVYQDGFGMSSFKKVYMFGPKLLAYFRCADGMYIPTYLLNNGEQDCLGGEDEQIPPNNFTCPGFYRCHVYGNCVHPDFVCDGVAHCPNKDDERYCGLSHPSDCTCEGYACSCNTTMPQPLANYAYLRYLDLSGVKNPYLDDLFMLNFLRFLNASFCQLSNATLKNMPQLEILDMSHNVLWEISSMVIQDMTGLTHLNLSGNPLVTKLDATFSSFLEHAGLLGMKHLVMKYTHVQEIEDNAFRALHNLDTLDLRGNKLKTFGKGIFAGLVSLDVLQADDPRLCCSYFHPKQLQCNAPQDELSSCNDLLRSDFFRVLLWALSFSTLLGNIAVFLHKVITIKRTKARPYQIFVSHLCVADFLMGVYMAMVGGADMYFRGSYVANERRWKQSGTCFAAGVLAFVSSEVSAFIICLITLDRLLMLCFPFKPHLHMTAKFSTALCCVVWVLGLLLAAAPFIGQFEFYGESSICLPLPITRHQFTGQTYAFAVFIVLNFLLFLFIGTGQLAIYWAVHRARAAVKNPRQEEQTSIARRLFLVVFTDFCCWFPVGLMGILVSAGVPIPGVVSVWAAVIVLPLNSALNPFLYTLNGLREKWNIRKIKKKSQRILGNLKGEIPKLAPSTVEEMIMIYLRSNKSVKLGKVSHFLQSQQEGGNNAGSNEKTSVLPDENTSETWVSSAE